MLDLLLKEIREIPQAADTCFNLNRNIHLPTHVPYLGMGASFNPILALYYASAPIYPDLSSEYYYYRSSPSLLTDRGVLISQSGMSSETLWCCKRFKKYIAITNDPSSHLATGENVSEKILMAAGEETAISSKTYINTLITLYQGLGFSVKETLKILDNQFPSYKKWGEESADQIFSFMKKNHPTSFCIVGSGPNLATAKQAALTMGEATKLGIMGMSLAEYDHGPKETAKDSIVIFIDIKGPTQKRLITVRNKIKNIQNCLSISLSISSPQESLSPLLSIIPFNFLTYYLAKKRGITHVYQLGGKIVQAQS